MSTNDLRLFHGTSKHLANGILREGSRNYLTAIGAVEFAAELYHMLLDLVPGWIHLGELFEEIGSDFSVTAPIALKNISEGYQKSLMAYGAFYVTLNPQIAVSYSVRNRCGSELLSIIRDSIEVLRKRCASRVDALLNNHPRICAALNVPYQPVVIEFASVPISQLETEDGNTDTLLVRKQIELFLELGSRPGVRVPGAFRAREIKPSHVVAVYPIPVDPVPTKLNEPGATSDRFDMKLFQSLAVDPRQWRSL